MAPKSGRHHVGNFDLNTPAASHAPAPANVPGAIPASEVRLPKNAPPARVRMGEHRVPARQGPAERRINPPLEPAPIPRDEVYRSPDDMLTGLQREMLAALDAVEGQVRPDLMLEVRNVVRRNLARTSITPNATERAIFTRIGVPGY